MIVQYSNFKVDMIVEPNRKVGFLADPIVWDIRLDDYDNDMIVLKCE